MSVPTKIIVNCETGVSAEVPLTSEEIAQREADAAAFAAALRLSAQLRQKHLQRLKPQQKQS